MRVLLVIGLILSLGMLSSCESEENTDFLDAYTGPASIAYDIELMHSDSTLIRTILRAKKQIEQSNGDMEFPDGIEIELYDKFGKLNTQMSANKGFYNKNDNLYFGQGAVLVVNLLKDQKLSSEELYWNPNEKKIYTEKFVTIQEKETLFNGTGMEADEGFNEYKLFKVTNSRTLLPGEGF
jgi:LPS export ABC transporter protein LptC